jgi:hypothetical protein
MGDRCSEVREFVGRRVVASNHGDGPQLAGFQVMFLVSKLQPSTLFLALLSI